jgi:hypothetical protein
VSSPGVKSESEPGFELSEDIPHLPGSLLGGVELLLCQFPRRYQVVDDLSGILPAELIHEIHKILFHWVPLLSLHLSV